MPQAYLFVAVLGASSYTYADATGDEQLANWIGAHVRAFEFYQGTPKLVVPDNAKTGVTKDGRGQELRSLRLGAESVSRRLLGTRFSFSRLGVCETIPGSGPTLTLLGSTAASLQTKREPRRNALKASEIYGFF